MPWVDVSEMGSDELGKVVTFFIIPVNRHVRRGRRLGELETTDLLSFWRRLYDVSICPG